MNPDQPDSRASENNEISAPLTARVKEKGMFHEYHLSGDFSDFTIVASCGREFKTHRIILSVNSTFFEAMLKNKDTKEAMEQKLVLDDVDASTIEKVLSWIYESPSQEINVSVDEITPEALIFVDRFLFHFISDDIDDILTNNLTADVFCERAYLASLLRNGNAFMKIVSYFADNKLPVMKTESYRNMCMEQPQLTISLLEKCIESDQKLLTDSDNRISELRTERENALFWKERYMQTLNHVGVQLFGQQEIVAPVMPEAPVQPQAQNEELIQAQQREHPQQEAEAQQEAQAQEAAVAQQQALAQQAAVVQQQAVAQQIFQAQQHALVQQIGQAQQHAYILQILQAHPHMQAGFDNAQDPHLQRFAEHVRNAQIALHEIALHRVGAVLAQRAALEAVEEDVEEEGAVGEEAVAEEAVAEEAVAEEAVAEEAGGERDEDIVDEM